MNSPNKETILIVNHNAEELEVTTLYLRQAGYRVLSAPDLREGVETVKQKQIDLIIGDEMVFGGDGLELCQSIRRDEELGTLPILLVSDSPKDADRAIADLKIAADYIESPIEPLRLITKTARLIERKRMEDLFRESESYFRSLIENMSDIISILSDDGTVLYESPAIEQILGYKPDELTGKNAFELIHPDDRQQVFSYFKQIIKNEGGESDEKLLPAEYRFQTKKGAWRILESTGKVIKDPSRGTVVIVNSRNVTEQRKAENARRQSVENFRKVLENSRDAIYQLNLKTKNFDYISPAAKEISGYSLEELVKGGLSFVNSLVHPEDWKYFREYIDRIQNTAKTDNTDYNVEYRFKTKEKGYRWLSENRTVIRDKDQSPLAVIATARDLTERRQAEQNIRFQAHLLDTVEQSVIATDLAGNVVYWNHFAQKLYGWTSAEATGRNIIELTTPMLARRQAEEIMSHLRAGKGWTGEFSVQNQNGAVFPAVVTNSPIFDDYGNLIGIVGISNNISERKQAEDVLRESENRYRQLVELSPIAIIINCENKIVFTNKAGFVLFGADQADQVIGRTILDFIDPDYRELVLERMEKISRGHPVPMMENKIVRLDGTTIEVESAGIPFNYMGKAADQVIMRDISERKLAERIIKESEKQYRFLFEAMPQQVWSAQPDGLLDYVNQRSFDYFGFETEQERMGDSWQQVIYPDDLPACVENWNRSLTTGEPYQVEFRLKKSDGEYQWHLGQATAMRNQDGEIIKWIGTNTNIEELKKAEAAILTANKRAISEYERLLDRIAKLSESFGAARDLQTIYRALHTFAAASTSCSEFVVSLDDAKRDARVAVYVSDGGKEIDISELTEWRMPNNSNNRAKAICDVDAKDDLQTIKANQPTINSDINDARSPSSSLIVPMSVMGRVIGSVEVRCEESADFTNEHVTALKMAANLAATAIENVSLLEQEQKTAEQVRLSQRLESIGRLAGGIAHDFNNMLTAINGYSELTLRRLGADHPLRGNLEEIKKAGQRSASLTHQLLAFSRQQILQSKVIDLNEIILDTTKMLQRLIGEDVRLQTVLDAKLGNVLGDAGQLTQVIMNLAVNARDAMPKGGNLIIKTKNVYLDEEFAARFVPTQPGSYIQLIVTDTGVGIESEMREHIFEPFYTTKEIGKGTGLGLATVYGIVKQSGGYIWVESEVGCGATFDIYLPRIDSEVQPEEVADASEFFPKGRETVLIVEDEETVRAMTREMLEECGYHALEARSGVEALSLIEKRECEIDLVMTDVVMPQISGRELAEKLAVACPQMPILFTSGYTDDEIIRHDVIKEETNFIQKPFTLDALARKVRGILDVGK